MPTEIVTQKIIVFNVSIDYTTVIYREQFQRTLQRLTYLKSSSR